MRKAKFKETEKDFSFVMIILILVIMVVLLICGLSVVRDKLVENTFNYGVNVIDDYANSEEKAIQNFEKHVHLASCNLEERMTLTKSYNDTQRWFQNYEKIISYFEGDSIINFFGVVDNQAYSAVASKYVSYEQFTSRDWYKDALAADGKVVYTEIYRDRITGKEVSTIAKKMKDSNNVLALDFCIDPKIYDNHVAKTMNTAAFYIFDKNDTLYFYHNPNKEENFNNKKYADDLLKRAKKYGNDPENFLLRDSNGVVQATFSKEMSNGSIAIMSVPINDIMEGKKNVALAWMLFFSLVIIALIVILSIREIKVKQSIHTVENTMVLLGDMYYAIYKVNEDTNQFDCIKAPDNLIPGLGKKGQLIDLVMGLQEISTAGEDSHYDNRFQLIGDNSQSEKSYSYYGGEFLQEINGETKWVDIRIIKGGKLDFGEAIWCFRIVDEEKKKQLENTKMLKDTILRDEKREKRKNRVFSKMSHDMRTPLNAIIGFRDLSQSHTGDAECLMDYINKMGKSADQLLGLINEILEFSKIDQDSQTLNVNKFNIEEIFDDIETSFAQRMKTDEKNIVKKIDIKNHCVVGDELKLTQIINNLISNSLKYSKSGDSVILSLKEFEMNHVSEYQITVEDNGIGMSKEFLEHIYEPYAREMQDFVNIETVGTGLGMLIVKNLVSIMNGKISIESELGVGTKVTVTLPFEVAAECEEETTNDQKQIDEQEQKDFFTGMNILVAEDNELNMEILYEMLKMRGVNSIKAWNGREAVSEFEKSSEGYFDCILMDMQMPEMDGCEATKAIRKLERCDSKSIPIFAVTANAFAEDINETTVAGMNGHITKPLDFNVLYQLLKKNMAK